MSRLLPALLLILAVIPRAGRAQNTATDTIRQAETRIRALLGTEPSTAEAKKTHSEALHGAIDRMLDVEAFSKLALRDWWRELDLPRRRELVGLLGKLAHERIRAAFARADGEPTRYLREEVQGGETHVVAQLRGRRRAGGHIHQITVRFVLTKTNGDWKLVDLITDGVALGWTYRAKFRRIVRRKGLDGLVRKLREKVR